MYLRIEHYDIFYSSRYVVYDRDIYIYIYIRYPPWNKHSTWLMWLEDCMVSFSSVFLTVDFDVCLLILIDSTSWPPTRDWLPFLKDEIGREMSEDSVPRHFVMTLKSEGELHKGTALFGFTSSPRLDDQPPLECSNGWLLSQQGPINLP